jgi:hypothetical protein
VLLDQFVLVLHNVTNSSLPSSLYQDVCGVLFC